MVAIDNNDGQTESIDRNLGNPDSTGDPAASTSGVAGRPDTTAIPDDGSNRPDRSQDGGDSMDSLLTEQLKTLVKGIMDDLKEEAAAPTTAKQPPPLRRSDPAISNDSIRSMTPEEINKNWDAISQRLKDNNGYI